jgi:PAS domain S-box-containing protein
MRSANTITRTTTKIAVVLAAIVALCCPIGYYAISYQYLHGSLETEADNIAAAISQLISKNPDLWGYEQYRLKELLSHRAAAGYAMTLRIVDMHNKVIVENAQAISAPVVKRSSDLLDSGIVVGRVELYRSLQPILIKTGILTLFGVTIGLMIFATLRLLPLRAMRTAEETLQKSEEKYRSLVESTEDSIYVVDRDCRYLFINSNYLSKLGLSREQYPGRAYSEFHSAGDTENFAREVARVFETGEFVRYEQTSPGDGKYFLLTLSPVKGPDGKTFAVSVVSKNVTELKRAEEMLTERSAQLERTNRRLVTLNAELDDFTRMASHDLQEPLRTLVTFSDMLGKDLGPSLPERAAEDLNFLTDAAKRMQTLIQDLLALARASRAPKKREMVSLDTCADWALEALTVRMKETGAQITRDTLPEVWGDATLLTQLYQNLIANALKFSENQRPVIRLTSEEKNGGRIFGVKDDGIGIEAKYVQQIFKPFRRLHSRGEYEGSGIGLAICQKIVERHGGKIWVESEKGKGAHFRFTISHRRREPGEGDGGSRQGESDDHPSGGERQGRPGAGAMTSL